MDNLAIEISRILDEYQRQWESTDTNFESESLRKELLNEIAILRSTLVREGALDAAKAVEFRRLIYHKLAMKRDSDLPSDWWRTPPHALMERLLTKISLSINEAIRPAAWRRYLSFTWAIVKELLFLGIVIGLLLASQNQFERRVVSILALVYTYVGLECGRLGFHLTGFELEINYVVGRIARRMGIAWDDTTESDAVREGLRGFHLRMLSLYVGRVVALIGLVLSFL
jgi:hypothetical protein